MKFLIRFLTKFQYWKHDQVWYGFYVNSSPCSVSVGKSKRNIVSSGHTWYRNIRLRLALGKKDFYKSWIIKI